MAFAPYQPPMGGNNYQAPYMPYVPPRFDAPQQPQNAPGMASMPGSTTPPPQAGFLCRPVTSREEALGVQTDYFSPGTLMPDLGHGIVYMKRFNQNTGASDLFEFALVQEEAKAPQETPPGEVVPPKILEDINGQLDALLNRLDDLAARIDQPRPKQVSIKGGNKE